MRFKTPKLARYFLAIAALACLGLCPPQKTAQRGLASCVETPTQQFLPLSTNLIGQIRNRAVRNNAYLYYLKLSQAENEFLGVRNGTFSTYGLSKPSISLASLYATPKIVDYDFSASQGTAFGGLFGDFGAAQSTLPAANPGIMTTRLPTVGSLLI